MSAYPRRTFPFVLGAVVVLLIRIASAQTQNPTLQGHPDDYPRADVEGTGARLYAQHCFGCHGNTGDGVAGVDLRSGKFRNCHH